MLRRGARERVDRLVVVADDAELVASTEPPFEQGVLQRVHVLVLVDRERVEPFVHEPGRLGLVIEQPHEHQQHVLEVHAPLALGALVGRERTLHEIRRQRGCPVRRLDRLQVPNRVHEPVLRPLDLAGELAARQEPVRAGQAVRDRVQDLRLRVQHLGQVPPGEPRPQGAELAQGGRVERASLDALDTQAGQPGLQLTGRLLGERHCEHGGGLERADLDLMRDAVGDRRGLAGARARQDHHRPAHGLGRTALRDVQPGERVGRGCHRRDATSGLGRIGSKTVSDSGGCRR